MNQNETPLFDALLAWREQNPVSFHVPGHKNGNFFPERAKKVYKSLLSIDATELNGLDDLHEPEAAIGKAQQLTANLYGCEESYFLVGGSTVGNLAMILASCHEGETVLVQRNSHKSIMNGLELTNANPVFLSPFVDDEAQIAAGVTIDVVKKACYAYPDAKAIILTNPNYYGMTVDLQEIIQFAHAKGMIVLVDEAHGAHFGIHPLFPTSALALGADAVVQSAHKTLPAMTMGSYLHVNKCFPKRKELKKFLAMLQSSSPSYPIMASLDVARYYLSQLSEEEIEHIIKDIRAFREKLGTIRGIRLLDECGQYKQDPLKIVIQSETNVSGFHLQKRLEDKGVYTELADELNVLFVMPLAPLQEIEKTIGLISCALKGIEQESCLKKAVPIIPTQAFSTLKMDYKAMAKASPQLIDRRKATGKVAAEAVIPYPPGIPLLMKGEEIKEEHLMAIERLIDAGARFHGGNMLRHGQMLVF